MGQHGTGLLFSEPASALFEIIARHVFPGKEKTCVDIYADVFRALTLANDLLDKALMKLSVSVFDISLPSQHLVFVFDAPKWLLMRPASVPALWNEEMCCSAASRRCCYSAIRNSESSSFGCYSFCPLPARPGVSLQLLQVRHTSLCVLIWEEIFIHLSSCPSAVDAQLSLMQTERRGAGHFLPHLRAGKVWKSEGSCAFGAISLFFFFFWVQEKHVAGWSSQA